MWGAAVFADVKTQKQASPLLPAVSSCGEFPFPEAPQPSNMRFPAHLQRWHALSPPELGRIDPAFSLSLRCTSSSSVLLLSHELRCLWSSEITLFLVLWKCQRFRIPEEGKVWILPAQARWRGRHRDVTYISLNELTCTLHKLFIFEVTHAVYSNSGTQSSSEDECSKTTFSNIPKSQKHNVEGEKPVTKQYILFGYICNSDNKTTQFC